MAKSGGQAIEYNLWLSGRCHSWCKFADCKDLEKFGDCVSVLLIFGILESREDRGGIFFDKSGLLLVSHAMSDVKGSILVHVLLKRQ